MGCSEKDVNQADDLDHLWSPFSPIAPHRDDIAHHQRGRRGTPLSRTEIVHAAIAIADAEGADAINMRRIAKELRVGTMSLYWHVADKAHLLDLMLDAVEGEDEAVPASGDWRGDLAHLAHLERQCLLRHRWAMDFIGGRPSLGPNTLLRVKQSLALLDGVDLGARTAIDILMTLNTYVMGAVPREMREIRFEQDQERGGIDQETIEAGMDQWREQLRSSGRFQRFMGFSTKI